MNKSITQLIEDISKEIAQENHIGTNLVTGHKAAYFKEMALRVAKQVREATIKECAKKVTWSYNGPEEYLDSYAEDIVINREKLTDLDLNTIIL